MNSSVENRIATLLDTDPKTLKIVREEDSQYLVATPDFKNYIYDEKKDALLDMRVFNKKEQNEDKFLTQEEKADYWINNQGLIGFSLRKINIIDGVEVEELRDVCTLGFTKALTTFNKKAGIKFSTYCVKCMLNEMYYYLKKEQRKIQNNVSFNKTLSTDHDGNDLTVGDLIADTRPNTVSTESKILNNELREILLRCIDRLEDDEQFLIIYRYGLDNGTILTQSDIAQKLHMSQANVSKLEKLCLKKLRLIMKRNHYEYKAKTKSLVLSQTLDYTFGADEKYNHLDKNSTDNIIIIACERLGLNITEIISVENTDKSNEFIVRFKKNSRIYGIVNTITNHVELKKCELSNTDRFMSYILDIPYLGVPMKTDVSDDRFNIVYSNNDLNEALDLLSENEYFTITRIYGIANYQCMTTHQIAEKLGKTVDDVIELKKHALKKIETFFWERN